MRRVEVVWGRRGLEAALPESDVVVVVDVLSFTTAVDVAVSRGVTVYPYHWRDDSAAAFADTHDAALAGPRTTSELSLSPASLRSLEPGSRVVLPSPNGSRLSLATGELPTLAGCLRNARATALAAAALGDRVTIVAAGERWPDDSLRPALEDWLGAGAIVAHLEGERRPGARAALSAFRAAGPNLTRTVRATRSGEQLIELGFAEDVEIATELDAGDLAPRLQDGAFRPADRT